MEVKTIVTLHIFSDLSIKLQVAHVTELFKPFLIGQGDCISWVVDTPLKIALLVFRSVNMDDISWLPCLLRLSYTFLKVTKTVTLMGFVLTMCET